MVVNEAQGEVAGKRQGKPQGEPRVEIKAETRGERFSLIYHPGWFSMVGWYRSNDTVSMTHTKSALDTPRCLVPPQQLAQL